VVDRRTGSGSDDSVTSGDDLRGEDLAGHHVPEPVDYEIAPDETEAEELTEATDEPAAEDLPDSAVVIDDAGQLEDAEKDARAAENTEPATLAARMASARPARKVVAVPKKDAPTPSRRRATGPEREKRTTPAQFVNQSIDELKKVVWPTGRQVQQYFVVVLVFVLFIMAYVVGLDTGFGAALLKLFG
jgi:preprotein translocase subunit SecE